MTTISAALPRVVADSLCTYGLDPLEVALLARDALAEDLALGPDVTTAATVTAEATSIGDVSCRTSGVLAGVDVAASVLHVLAQDTGASVRVDVLRRDGDRLLPGDVVLTAAGPTRTLLTAERTMLNLVCHLSGVATLTAQWVDAVRGTGAAVRDTRKTTPRLRRLEKHAVRCGGGFNHRMALGDAALIKDNHVAAAGGVAAALHAVRRHAPDVPVEVECDTLEQVRQAVGAGATLVLLDNMTLEQMGSAVAYARPFGVRLEASGGLTLDSAAAVAATGVDFLAVGAVTHSATVLDLGFDLRC